MSHDRTDRTDCKDCKGEEPWRFIPKIYIATLEKSRRIPQVEKDLCTMGIQHYEFNYQIPPLVKNLHNVTLSCTENHLQIYTKALKEKLPFICVFEDDVYIPPSHLHRIKKVLLQIENFIRTTHDWDIIFLGNFPWKIGNEKSEGIYEGVFWCTHSYLISERGMRYMLQYSPSQMMEIGRKAVPSVFDMFFREGGGIDTFLAYSTTRNKIKSFAVVPMLVEQLSISNWTIKARLAEKISRGGWWSYRIFYIVWVLYWLILLVIIYTLRKKLIDR